MNSKTIQQTGINLYIEHNQGSIEIGSPQDIRRITESIVKELSRQLNISQPETSSLSDGEMYIGDDIESFSMLSKEEFCELITKWSSKLPKSSRQDEFRKIAKFAWDTIVYHPDFAEELLQYREKIDDDIWPILLMLCHLSFEWQIEHNEALDFLHSLQTKSLLDNNKPLYEHSLLVLKFIRYLFYHPITFINSKTFIDEFTSLITRYKESWEEFFVDLYYRHLCGYLSIENILLEKLVESHQNYMQRNPMAPLAQLYPFIIEPYVTFKNYESLDNLMNHVNSIAIRCESLIECRWTISSLFRILPLYKFSSGFIDYPEKVIKILDNMDQALVAYSSFIKFIHLNTLLKSFLKTHDKERLSIFEKEFIKFRNRLSPPQIVHLQMEYASCLYIGCQFHDIDFIQGLMFSSIASSERNPLETILFHNYLISKKARFNVTFPLSSKQSIFKWLFGYIKTIYQRYAHPLIESSHLTALWFDASNLVYGIRKSFKNDVTTSLCRNLESNYDRSFSFYAKSLATFRFIDHAMNVDKTIIYLQNALKAKKYYILINAGSIGYALYDCFYYGNEEISSKASELTEVFYTLSDIGKGVPQLHWIYYAGIQYRDHKDHEDEKFIYALYNAFKRGRNKIYQLALKRNETVEKGLFFPDKILDIITVYSQRNSLFALVASEEIEQAEVWNMMATTVINCRDRTDPLILDIACTLYSIAKCFARTYNEYDQKYCYNYIRFKSMYYLALDEMPDAFFIRDTAFYLSRPQASIFGHIKECTDPFFQLLFKYWKDISMELQELFTKNIISNPSNSWISIIDPEI